MAGGINGAMSHLPFLFSMSSFETMIYVVCGTIMLDQSIIIITSIYFENFHAKLAFAPYEVPTHP